ncbi:hypothetical protein GC176_09770 [bacterium]|nr:hypothetical protein [bacterium]
MNGVISSTVPRLLVSVRSAQEAKAALAGGCDILDVKDPSRGPLGMASHSVIMAVAEVAAGSGASCSVACGEAAEFAETPQFFPENVDEVSATSGIAFFKLGPARLLQQANWQQGWRSAFQTAARHFAPTANDSSASQPKAVVVAYADWQRCDAPSPDGILDAVETNTAASQASNFGSLRFAGLLIDTFDKSSGTLLDCLSVGELEAIAGRLRGMTGKRPAEQSRGDRESYLDRGSRPFLALAGRLSPADLDRLVPVRPDVIAVRSAACRGHDRQSTVDAEVTRQFRAQLQMCFTKVSAAPAGLLATETA